MADDFCVDIFSEIRGVVGEMTGGMFSGQADYFVDGISMTQLMVFVLFILFSFGTFFNVRERSRLNTTEKVSNDITPDTRRTE